MIRLLDFIQSKRDEASPRVIWLVVPVAALGIGELAWAASM